MSVPTLDYFAAIEHMPRGSTLILADLRWEEYETLLAQLGDDRSARLSYDEGVLMIMSPSVKHEVIAKVFHHFISVLTEELGWSFVALGSTTLKRRRKAKGVEPDDCFYIKNAEHVIGKEDVDLNTDPPPDLAIEIDVAHQSSNKFPIYAGLGVPELWLYKDRQVYFYRLTEGCYTESARSDHFPFMTPDVLAQFLHQENIQDLNTVKRAFRDWVKAHKPA